MTSKKKFIIALSSVSAVCVALIVSLVVVLAASNISIQSGVDVGYTAREIIGSISASYQAQDDTQATPIGTAELDGTEDDDLTEKLGSTTNKVTLTKKKKYVDYIFTLTCAAADADTSGKAYTAVLTYTDATSDDKNVKITYKVDDGEFSATNPATTTSSLTVGVGETKTVTVRVEIDSVAKDSTFTGTFNWALATTIQED